MHNYALACYLAGRGVQVHLVTHRAWADLAARPNVHVHRVARPGGSHLLGMPLLARAGRRWARRLAPGGARVVVNGGNCAGGDVNWVHYVHAAWAPLADGGPARRLKAAAAHRYFLRTEGARVRRARRVVANSEGTRVALIERLGLPPERVRVVYYGSDPGRFRPPTAAERAGARGRLGWAEDGRPAVAFVGALGDRRKGFDTLFAAWRTLAGRPSWDARLVVVGAGAALAAWRARAAAAGLGRSVQFLGFRGDVPAVLAACDLLVSPARYEPYGLNVHEALCCGLPALVSPRPAWRSAIRRRCRAAAGGPGGRRRAGPAAAGLARRRRGPRRGRRPAGAGPAPADLGPLRRRDRAGRRLRLTGLRRDNARGRGRIHRGAPGLEHFVHIAPAVGPRAPARPAGRRAPGGVGMAGVDPAGADGPAGADVRAGADADPDGHAGRRLRRLAAGLAGPGRGRPPGPGPRSRFPAAPWLGAGAAWLVLSIVHPTTNSLLAGGARRR